MMLGSGRCKPEAGRARVGPEAAAPPIEASTCVGANPSGPLRFGCLQRFQIPIPLILFNLYPPPWVLAGEGPGAPWRKPNRCFFECFWQIWSGTDGVPPLPKANNSGQILGVRALRNSACAIFKPVRSAREGRERYLPRSEGGAALTGKKQASVTQHA